MSHFLPLFFDVIDGSFSFQLQFQCLLLTSPSSSLIFFSFFFFFFQLLPSSSVVINIQTLTFWQSSFFYIVTTQTYRSSSEQLMSTMSSHKLANRMKRKQKNIEQVQSILFFSDQGRCCSDLLKRFFDVQILLNVIYYTFYNEENEKDMKNITSRMLIRNMLMGT